MRREGNRGERLWITRSPSSARRALRSRRLGRGACLLLKRRHSTGLPTTGRTDSRPETASKSGSCPDRLPTLPGGSVMPFAGIPGGSW